MSTTISIKDPFYLGYGALNYRDCQGSAYSSEAQVVRQGTNAVNDTIELSQALFGDKLAAISDLSLLAEECKEEDWDGYGAGAIDERAVLLAVRFVRALPEEVCLPEFAPEPDGSVSLDWARSRNRVFSLSVGVTNRLAYAWLDGTDKGHGVSAFDGQRIPKRILQGIQDIMSGC